jgi:LmbE family N-acetylglucosaminyl deacetylase
LTATRHIFLSPHPDDAVWSCGGLLLRLVRAGERVLVVTVFDGDAEGAPPSGWRHIASPELRRRENDRALTAIGVAGLSLGLVDAALRRSDDDYLYRDADALLGPLAPADDSLGPLLTSRLVSVLRQGDQIYVPMAGSGTHVDHRIVRSAADGSMASAVTYYSEFPYTRQQAQKPAEMAACESDEWIEMAGLYRSQVVCLFGTRNRFAAALRAWAGTDRRSNSSSGRMSRAG